jgi:serine/threonine-protein kinase
MRSGALETASKTTNGTRIGPFKIRCRDDANVRQFVHDVRVAVRLQQRGLLRVHDVGQLASGEWYMVLDEATAGGGPGDGGSRYQLGARLGAGGMAEVFRATMVGVEGFMRDVAIKRVRSGLSHDTTFRAMFIREAQIAAQLAHPNIVSVHDFSVDASERLFLVMEYVDGVDLATLLASGPVAPSLAIFLTVEMLRGLGYAHGRGAPVVHRDVSPQNLLLGFEGAVKVSDFGLARVRAASDEVADAAPVRGKPSYMAPEQINGQPVDGRADLYAAGVVLWEMLAQRPLFAGTTREIVSQAMFRDVMPPSAFRPGVPADVEAVAMRLIARDRARRHARAQDAIGELLACRDVSRDGRGELVALLAERFAGTASARLRRLTAPPEPVVLAQPVVLAPASPVTRTARSRALPAAQQVASRKRARGARPLGLVAAVSVVGVAALVARGVAAHWASLDGAALDGAALGGAALGDPARAPRFVPPPPGPMPSVGPASVPPATPIAAARHSAVEPAPPRAAPAHRLASSGPDGPASAVGELTIIVRPWALVWLNGQPRGQTPFRHPLPAGTYQVVLHNDALGVDENTSVVVEPDHTATIERMW